MKRRTIMAFISIIACAFISSCGHDLQKDIARNDGAIIESSSLPYDDITAASTAEETPEAKDNEEALFINDVIFAINHNDYDYLQRHADYYNPAYGINGIEVGLKLLKEMLLEGETILRYEAVGDSNITPPAKLIRTYTESGHSRIFIIYNDSQQGFRFSDPLITMGIDIVKRTQSYVDAIKSNDIEALYNYLVMIHEDSEAKPYIEEGRSQEYVSVAKTLVGKYQEHMKLTSIELELTRIKNDTSQYVSTVYIEYSVTGKSPDGEAVQHSIQGVYEAPLIGVLDEWLTR